MCQVHAWIHTAQARCLTAAIYAAGLVCNWHELRWLRGMSCLQLVKEQAKCKELQAHLKQAKQALQQRSVLVDELRRRVRSP